MGRHTLIERLYLRDLVTFDEVELEFDRGLVVLTGPSGAGKSVLMSAILSSFGYVTQGVASLCELNVAKPVQLRSEAYELEEELTLKTLKKEKLRYFIDGQKISKKALNELFIPYVKYLSVRDRGGIDSASLLNMIDGTLASKDKNYRKLLKEYKKRYGNYRAKVSELEHIREQEAKLAELIEFTSYEIEKIERIAPKPDEEEELLTVKQQLSRIDKIKEAMQAASGIFSYEGSVEEVYRLLDKDPSAFSEVMNQLRADLEETEILAEELEEIDVEAVLDRLSDLTVLKNRYGSIEEALAYKEEKKKELAGYRHIEQDKSMLESFLALEFSELMTLAGRLSLARKQEALLLETVLKNYLETLKLPPLAFIFNGTSLDEQGTDHVEIRLGSLEAATLSGGEFNRVRLALMAATIDDRNRNRGVLILDEIDANVSGDESIAIATMVSRLSSAYQIFAISHQPHLSAMADQHIAVTKTGETSSARILDDKGRVEEIARIIGGERPSLQALEFAKRLRSGK